MLQYFETLQDESGNALAGATVTVTNYPSGTAASIYSTNGTASPIAGGIATADVTGQVAFFVPNGAYTLVYAVAGTPYKTKTPVQMFDPLGFVAGTDTGSANVYVVTSSAYPVSLYVGLQLEFLATHANTGASTLNLNATGNQPINQPGGSALIAGMIQANGLTRLEWDGAEWQLIASQSQPFFAASSAENTAGVTPTSYAYQPGDLRRYGATDVSAGGSTDSTAAITTALSIVQQSFAATGCVFLTTGSLSMVSGASLVGPGKIKLSGGSNNLFNLSASNISIKGLAVDCSANTTAEKWFVQITGAINNVEISDCLVASGRIVENGTNTSNIRILRNNISGACVSSGSGGTIAFGVSTACTYFAAIDNYLSATGGAGISTSNACQHGIIRGNKILSMTGPGIYAQQLAYGTVEGNQCINGSSTGIGWNNATAPVPQRSTIANNICVGNAQDGLDINFSNSASVPGYLTITGNYLENNGQTNPYGTGINLQYANLCTVTGNIMFGNGLDGIRVYGGQDNTIVGNLSISNGAVTPGTTYSGISFYSASNCTAHGNVCTNLSGGANQFYGIHEDSGSSGNIISGNNCVGNVTGTVLIQGALSILKDDVGGYIEQAFTLAITNSSGTLQHAIYGQSGAIALGNYSSRINNATASNTNTPTGTDSTTPFAGGGKISSVTANNFIFDTAAQTVGFTDAVATLEFNSTTNALAVRLQMLSQNVNGVTQYRPNLSFTNPTTGAAVNLTTANIPNGDTIEVRFRGRLF